MAETNLPKVILTPSFQEGALGASSSSSSSSGGSSSSNPLQNVRLYEIATTYAVESLQDIHQERMKNMRKELEHLKETEWKYEPINKYIAH